MRKEWVRDEVQAPPRSQFLVREQGCDGDRAALRRARISAAMLLPLLTACLGPEGEVDDGRLGQLQQGALVEPTGASYDGTDSIDAELGDMESEEHQGLAACPRHWIWSTVDKLYRVPRGGDLLEPVSGEAGIPQPFRDMGYDHFGDGECASGHYFASLIKREGGGSDKLVLEYTEELELIAFGRISQGEFMAINPVDGMIYAQHGRTLRVYSRSMMRRFHYDASQGRQHFIDNQFAAASLEQLRAITLLPRNDDDAWWSKVIPQGGAFSSNGVYYVATDHMTEEYSQWTGARAFDVTPFAADDAPEFDIPGAGANGILRVGYSPVSLGYRYEELEGITVYSNEGEPSHRVKVTMLTNEDYGLAHEDDDVTVFKFRSHEPPRPAVNDYWYRAPALW